jgi:hypothetical protein
MKRRTKWLFYCLLVLLFLLHNDFWFWKTPQLVLGMPVGLLYHIGFCLAVTLLMVIFVKDGEDWRER